MSHSENPASHLRNRSSVTRFRSQISTASNPSIHKQPFNHVSDEDRTKFQSFKFPRTPSQASPSHSSACFDNGLPTPPPSSLDQHFFPNTPSPLAFAEAHSLPTAYPSLQHQGMCQSSHKVDLVSMESYAEETFEQRRAVGSDSDPNWSSSRWRPGSSGPVKSPYGGHFVTPSVGAGFYLNTYPGKRRLIFCRGLPSAPIIRILLLGCWIAVIAFIVLAFLFVSRGY